MRGVFRSTTQGAVWELTLRSAVENELINQINNSKVLTQGKIEQGYEDFLCNCLSLTIYQDG
jgi:hypothetical protein